MLDIRQYRAEDLCSILFEANSEITPLELIRESNQHVKFFQEYLGNPHGLNAKFYVVEREYINVDYLTDYSFYYSKSFIDYGNKCVRLHFFTSNIEDLQEFKDRLKSELIVENTPLHFESTFWEDYLGFIVIRPIPSSFIGFTILKHYNYNKELPLYDALREYWGIKEYTINVFGRKLKMNSLAFMSQDGNVAACATIAVWSMLQIAVENYFINLKSPYEITKDAGLTVNNGNRLIPNTGLDPVSVCTAITKCNLVTEIRWLLTDVKFQPVRHANFRIKKLINAYSGLRLPIILGMYVPDAIEEFVGHAVAIAGHHSSEILTPSDNKFSFFNLCKNEKVLWRAQKIDQLYSHDDQWGPFSKMELIGDNEILTSWTIHSETTDNCRPIALIIPVFQKVRISYEEIESFTLGLDYFITSGLGDQPVYEIAWDIKLYFSAEFKNIIKDSKLLDTRVPYDHNLLLNFLTEPMPKYIWVSTLYFGEYPIINFIYDATGLRHANCFLFSLCYYQTFIEKMMDRLIEINDTYSESDDVKIKLQSLFGDSISGFLRNLTKLLPNE